MLASEDDVGSLEALKFSLASEIVELVVLSADEVFLQTLREAVGGARRLWQVSSADKVSDLLVAGSVGILVLDMQVLQEAADVFVAQIKRQFPDLVVVAAGNREGENILASHISAGLVYRFIHKPMSPARAKLFAEAAVRKHDEVRRRAVNVPAARPAAVFAAAWLPYAAAGLLAMVGAVTWAIRSRQENTPAVTAAAAPATVSSRTPATAPTATGASAGAEQTEVRERLLARAENAVLEERWDEAAAAIDMVRKAGVESGRIAFLTAQLSKAREQAKAAMAAAHGRGDSKPDAKALAPLLAEAQIRLADGRLVEPALDSAKFYVREALAIDPTSDPALDEQRNLALRLLGETRAAIARRDFAAAAAWLDGAEGIASPDNINSGRALLAAARRQVDADAANTLLQEGTERLQQDHLVDPRNDSAKYYLLQLKQLDPGHAGLEAALRELGVRLLGNAKLALAAKQLDAARSWLDEASGIGVSATDTLTVRQQWEAGMEAQKFLVDVVAADRLTQTKSVTPTYPKRAEANGVEGWVEVDFTVAPDGSVKDAAMHASSASGIFDEAALKAVSQWRYQPQRKDGRSVAVRARVRIRFAR